MEITSTLTIYNSKRDRAGNCYYAFTFFDHATGHSVSATICGGESNIYAVLHGWSTPNEWDRTIAVNRVELKIREFDRMTKDWPHAGCHPDQLREFIKKSLAAQAA